MNRTKKSSQAAVCAVVLLTTQSSCRINGCNLSSAQTNGCCYHNVMFTHRKTCIYYASIQLGCDFFRLSSNSLVTVNGLFETLITRNFLIHKKQDMTCTSQFLLEIYKIFFLVQLFKYPAPSKIMNMNINEDLPDSE